MRFSSIDRNEGYDPSFTRTLELVPEGLEEQTISFDHPMTETRLALVLGPDRDHVIIRSEGDDEYVIEAPEHEDDIRLGSGDALYLGPESTPQLGLGPNVRALHCHVENAGGRLVVSDSEEDTAVRFPIGARYELRPASLLRTPRDEQRKGRMEALFQQIQEADLSHCDDYHKAVHVYTQKILDTVLNYEQARYDTLYLSSYRQVSEQVMLSSDEHDDAFEDAFWIVENYCNGSAQQESADQNFPYLT